MKKLIISVAILIFIMSSILWFGIKKMPDNGIYKKGSSKSLDDCLAVLIDNGVDSRYSTAKEHEKYIKEHGEDMPAIKNWKWKGFKD